MNKCFLVVVLSLLSGYRATWADCLPNYTQYNVPVGVGSTAVSWSVAVPPTGSGVNLSGITQANTITAFNSGTSKWHDSCSSIPADVGSTGQGYVLAILWQTQDHIDNAADFPAGSVHHALADWSVSGWGTVLDANAVLVGAYPAVGQIDVAYDAVDVDGLTPVVFVIGGAIVSGSPHYMDLQSVLMHEYGHVLGFDHDTTPGLYGVMLPAYAADGATFDFLSGCETSAARVYYGCSEASALFTWTGIYADTVMCQTQNEIGSDMIRLRAFASTSDYPSAGAVIDSFDAKGGEGALATYVHVGSSGSALFEWEEVGRSGRRSSSGIVPHRNGVMPGQPLSDSIAVDSLTWTEQLSEANPGTIENSPPLESNCADIMVYSWADSLASPVYDQIVRDATGLRIRKCLAPFSGLYGPDHSAQACLNAIAGVVAANQAWNTYCATHGGGCRAYPVSPGPELYIVGDSYITRQQLPIGSWKYLPVGVGTASFGQWALSCTRDCRSDMLLYDINGDGAPDGPVSRIPARNIRDATLAAAAAEDINRGRNMEAGWHVGLLAGDTYGDPDLAYPVMSAIRLQYSGILYTDSGILQEASYPISSPATDTTAWDPRANAFSGLAASGMRELFGYGGMTYLNCVPGRFINWLGSPYKAGRLATKQRLVSWLPACSLHDSWESKDASDGSVIRALMMSDTTKTMVAASVSQMDIGWFHNHKSMAEYLATARVAAGSGSGRTSVARIAFNAMINAAASDDELAQHALSTSCWGSYTLIGRGVSAGGGGCPVAETMAQEGWRTENTVLSRSATGVLGEDELKLLADATSDGGRYRVRLRENEQERTTLDAVGLCIVDRDPSVHSYRTDGGYVLGVRRAASRMWRSTGEDLTALLSGQSLDGATLEPGDTVYIAGSERRAVAAMSTASVGAGPVVADEDSLFDVESNSKELPPDDEGLRAGTHTESTVDQRVLAGTGLLIQQEGAPGEWKTVRRYYPRANFEEAVTGGVGSGIVRLVAVGRHQLRFVGRVVSSNARPIAPTVLAPVAAQHTRLGNVQSAVGAEGGALTYIEPGDTLNLEFDVPLLSEGKARDLFLVTRGVYTTLASSGLNGSPGSVAAAQFSFNLGPARPNPSTGRVTFAYTLARPTKAVLRLYNVAGRLVRTVVQEQQEAGPHEALWDGVDDNGARSPAGVYFYRLQADSWSSERKLVVIHR